MSPETLTDEVPPKNDAPFVDPPRGWRMGLRHLLYTIFYFALAFWLLKLVVLPIVVGSIVMLVAAAVSFAVLVARRLSTQQDALVGILAVAAEREMPLAPALDAISDHFRGEYRRKVRALAHYLKAGVSLPDALDREPGAMPPEAEILARVGSEVGTLAGALREAGATRVGLRPTWNALASQVAYYLYLLFIIQGVSGFTFYFILPRYEAILRDFGVPLPPSTMLVIQIGQIIEEWALLFSLLPLLEMAGMLAVLGALTGWSRLRIPFLDRLFVRRHTALVLRSLAWVVEGGYPMTRGLELLERWYPTGWVRTRIHRIIQDVQHGSDWVDSLEHHGLIRKADAAVLDSAKRAGNLPWAMRETAASGERRLAYRLQALLQVLTPIVLFALGLTVGLLAVAYFSPLIKVLEVLT